MYQKNKIKKSRKNYTLILPAIIVALGLVFFTLEKTGITDFSSTPLEKTPTQNLAEEEATSSNEPSSIDYGPAKPEDSSIIPDKNPDSQTPLPSNDTLAVTITSVRKNSTSTAYLIKAVVVGTDSGTCSATMSKGSKNPTANGNIESSSGQYSCMNLEVPLSSLDESGSWSVQVTVTDKSGATASTNAEVIL